LNKVETSSFISSGEKYESFAYLAFIKSELIYESSSDGSKLIDLVSSQIDIQDTRQQTKQHTAKRSTLKSNENVFVNILCNPNSHKKKQNLQLELHYRSNKQSNRHSVLINNCRVVLIFDWLLKLKNFISSNVPKLDDSSQQQKLMPTIQPSQQQQHTEVKLNLTNTDLVVVENSNDINSQALILRMTAFIEYNQRKINMPFQSCVQSIELFSCQMNAIEETALSIIDPITFTIYMRAKNISHDHMNDLVSQIQPSIQTQNIEYTLDISTEVFRLHFSYLDFKLFLTLINSVQEQLKYTTNPQTNQQHQSQAQIEQQQQQQQQNDNNKTSTLTWISINMNTLSVCIIDDCKDVDIPLADIQFSRLKISHNINTTVPLQQRSISYGQGFAEFALNIDYYNRLISGW
jgi:vacuolar protein sorting-associated protein 13D